MALVDVIKRETPQETARRLAREKAAKAAKPVSQVKINSSQADMIRKEAVKAPLIYKRGADISNLDETEQDYRDSASPNGTINAASQKYNLNGKSSEPVDWSKLTPKTEAENVAAVDQFKLKQTGESLPAKTLVDLSKALGVAGDAKGIHSIEAMRVNFDSLAESLEPEVKAKMFMNGKDSSAGLRPFGEDMLHNGFGLIEGLKLPKPEVKKPGGLVAVSPTENLTKETF